MTSAKLSYRPTDSTPSERIVLNPKKLSAGSHRSLWDRLADHPLVEDAAAFLGHHAPNLLVGGFIGAITVPLAINSYKDSTRTEQLSAAFLTVTADLVARQQKMLPKDLAAHQQQLPPIQTFPVSSEATTSENFSTNRPLSLVVDRTNGTVCFVQPSTEDDEPFAQNNDPTVTKSCAGLKSLSSSAQQVWSQIYTPPAKNVPLIAVAPETPASPFPPGESEPQRVNMKLLQKQTVDPRPPLAYALH